MKKLLLILLCLPLIFGCGVSTETNMQKDLDKVRPGISTDVHRDYYENGQIKSEGKVVYGKSDGLWKYYYQNGRLKTEGDWNIGEKDGLWKSWYENGQLKLVSNWIYNGNEYLHGFMKAYRENGQVISEGNYKWDKKNGWWKHNDENGQIKSEGIYESGHKTGWWKYYIKNKLDYEMKYEPGNRLRGWRFFFKNGKIKEQQDWFNDVKTQKIQIYKQCWNEEGMAIECIDSSVVDKFGDTIIIYELPKLVYQTFYNLTGEKRAEGQYNYKMAEIHKQEYMQLHDSMSIYNRHYSDNGKPMFSMIKRDYETKHPLDQYEIYSICQDFAVGIWKEYHKNGQLSSQGNYKDFKHDGLWRTYHENGQLRSEELYKDGELISETWWDENGEKKY